MKDQKRVKSAVNNVRRFQRVMNRDRSAILKPSDSRFIKRDPHPLLTKNIKDVSSVIINLEEIQPVIQLT
jgi:hypothetical protein